MVRFHADIDNSFVKKAIEQLGFKISFDESRETILGTKSFQNSEVEKLCCMERNLTEVKGITKIHYIHCDKKNHKSIPKKTKKFSHPIAIIVYSVIGFLVALVGVAISGCMNPTTMTIVVVLSLIGLTTGEFAKYHTHIYQKETLEY